jgi:tRNA pseudouridine13 synthase
VKLRRLPEDFEVTELTAVVPLARGPFGLYRLTKRGVGTLEAVDSVVRAWRLPREALSFGGLKDRHAVTRQHVTVQGGPPRDLSVGDVRLEHLGRLDHAFTAKDLAGNRFRLVLRDMSPAEIDAAEGAVPVLAADGVPAYFDDQRFGSMTSAGEHVAEPWARGDYEATLRRAFADANEHDRPRDRAFKQQVRERWGDWAGLLAEAPRGPQKAVLEHLARAPGDFEGALGRVRQDIRSLWLAAYQSALFNRVLAAWLERRLPPEARLTLDGKAGPLVFWTRLDDAQRAELAALELPLPSARVEVPPGPVLDVVRDVLAQDGLTLADLDVRAPRGSFFSKGWRAAVLRPQALTVTHAPDDLYPGASSLTLTFDLPPGAYATLVVKRLTAVAVLERGGVAPRTRRKQRRGAKPGRDDDTPRARGDRGADAIPPDR